MKIVEVSVQKLKPWPDLNPRRRFDKEELAELAASIKQHGVLEPVLVHESNGDGPWIVAGDRRLRAAKLAGLKTVPCLVRAYSEIEALEIALIENLERTDLTVVEEARGFQKWLTATGQSQRQLAEKIGRSQPYIANRIRLLELPDEVLELVEKGVLDMSVARDQLLPFVGIPEAKRLQLFRAVAKELAAAAKKGLVDQREAPRLIGGLAAKQSRPLRASDWGEEGCPVADLDHRSCTCNGPRYRYGYREEVRCFDDNWWNAANSKAAEAKRAAEKRAMEKLGKRAAAISKKEVVSEESLRTRLGYNGYAAVTRRGKLSNGPLLDPSALTPESLVRMKPSYRDDGNVVLACVDQAVLRKARSAATREKNRLVKEKKAARAEKDVAAVRRKRVTAATLRILMGDRLMADSLAKIAKELGLAVEVNYLRTEGLEALSDQDVELLAKVVQLRHDRGELKMWEDPIEKAVEGQLRRKYGRAVTGLAPAAKTPKPTKKKGAKTAA